MRWHTRDSQNCEGPEIQLFILGFKFGHKSLTGVNIKYGLGVGFIWGGRKILQLCAQKKVMTVRCCSETLKAQYVSRNCLNVFAW